MSTGVVTGAVVGGDADGDGITFAGSVTTAKGSVVVNTDGSFTYTPIATARAKAAVFTGPTADKLDTFSVTLTDGYGGTTKVAVSPSNTVAGNGLTTFCGCTLMPADTIFHADVSDLPVMAKSGIWLGVLGANRGATLGASWGGMWMKSTGGMPVNVVGATHPTETVIFNRGYSTRGPSIDSRPYAIPNRPIVEGMPSLPAWDRHLLVFQEGTCISQELYNVANGVEMPANSVLDGVGNALYRVRYGSKWIAEAGVHYDMSSPLYPAMGWANASHLPYLPLILRPDDLARGSIDHMLGIVIAKDKGTGYTWPSGGGDGTGVNPDGVPMGSVLRLRADFDMSGYSAATQVVLRALQEHGAVIYDSTAPGQDGAKLLAVSNGWAGTEHMTAQAELNTVPMSAFEVVDVSGILVDPTTGWQIHAQHLGGSAIAVADSCDRHSANSLRKFSAGRCGRSTGGAMKHSDSVRRRRQPYAWLGAGAVTLGIGAALASGTAVACADTGAGSGSAKASSDSSASNSASSTTSDSTTAKKATAHSARHSAATSSGGNVGSRKASAAAAIDAPAAAADTETTATETASATTTTSTGYSARVRAAAETTTTSAGSDTSTTTAAAVPAADPSPNMNGYLPSTPIVAGVAVNLAQQQIADAQTLLEQQTWGSGNIPAGLVAVIPQMLLNQAAWALDTWESATPGAQAVYAQTSGVPIVHELAGVSLLGALLLPTVATTSLSVAGLFLPLVGAFEGTGGITPVQNLVSTAAENGRVYALVPVTMRSTTEPIVYISVNGGPSTPVLVDTGSSGLVLTAGSVGDAAPLGSPTGTGTSGYSGGLSYSYTTYTTTVDFGNGIVSGPTSVNIVDAAYAPAALAFFHQLGGASGVLGIGANAAGPGPSIPTAALPGELSDGVFLYQGLFLGLAGVMVFGPNPLPTRTSVPGAPDAYLNVKINNGTPTQVGAIIDSGGVYGTILSSQIGGGSNVPVGTRISVYTPDGVLLYSYIVTSQNRPTVITSGLINTGYIPFQQGPVYINYTAPGGIGSTDFDYA